MEGERRETNFTMSVTSVGDMLHDSGHMERIHTMNMNMFHVARANFLRDMMATHVHMKPVTR
eukprot:8970348-Karenia_brevis.AAC.1